MLERERQTGTQTHTEKLVHTVNLQSSAHRDPEGKAPAEPSTAGTLLHSGPAPPDSQAFPSGSHMANTGAQMTQVISRHRELSHAPGLAQEAVGKGLRSM